MILNASIEGMIAVQFLLFFFYLGLLVLPPFYHHRTMIIIAKSVLCARFPSTSICRFQDVDVAVKYGDVDCDNNNNNN